MATPETKSKQEAVRHLKVGDVIASGEKILAIYPGAGSYRGRMHVRLEGENRKTGKPYVRQTDWNASTKMFITRP